jgi:hypothetical protein
MEHIAYGRSLNSRIAQNTNPLINQMIMDHTEKSLLFYAEHMDQVDDRINRLKNEMDVSQALASNASLLGMFGLFMSLVARARIFILFTIVALMVLTQNSLSGWSPPDMLLRRLGFRTKEEIQMELYGLRMLKGDFDAVPAMKDMPVKDRVEWVIDLLSS